MNTATLVAGVLEALRAAAVPERRAHGAGYFPSDLEILGVPAPSIRAALRPVARQLRESAPDPVIRVAGALVRTDVHEARQLAWELIGCRPDVIARLDAAAVEALGRGNDNWATVDGFSVYVAGPAWREGRISDEDVARWAEGGDRWWRRTALVSTVALNQRSRGGSGDAPRTLAVCELLAHDRDPMVAKALSWALRTLVGVDADEVRAFLARRGEALHPLVRREVRKKLETGCKDGRRTR